MPSKLKIITMPASPLYDGGDTLRVILPIPSAKLSPNGRIHWAAKATLTKAARSRAFLLTKHVVSKWEPPTPAGYSLAYYWPSTIRRDDDNAIASAKAYLDGMCSALGIDDKTLSFRTLTHHRDRTAPRLEITFHIPTAS